MIFIIACIIDLLCNVYYTVRGRATIIKPLLIVN